MKAERLQSLLAAPEGQWPRRDWALLDIREQGEAHAGHIYSATFLPRRLIEFRIAETVPRRTLQIVIYDSGEHPVFGADLRAELARQTLIDCGYVNVSVLEGGFSAWVAAGGSVATGSNVPSKLFGERVLEEDAVPSLSAPELAEALSDGKAIGICDVRTAPEFVDHHLPRARSTPGFDLAPLLDDLTRQHARLVLSCAGRTRSIIATATARQLGFENVLALENGTMGWRLAGYGTEAGASLSETADEAVSGQKTSEVQGGHTIVARAEDLAREAGARPVDVAQLAVLLCSREEQPYILDMRALEAYRAGHIPGAIALPGGQAIQRTDDFLAVPGHPVVLVDDGRGQAALGGYWLRRMGFTDVAWLAGGYPAWARDARPSACGRPKRSRIDLEELRDSVARLTPEELLGRFESDTAEIAILDTRTSREYAKAHLAGASWVPRGWLETYLQTADISARRSICLVARDEEQALLAARQLQVNGAQNVAVLSGQAKCWAAAGLPVETGGPAPSPFLPDVVEPPYSKGLAEMRDYLDWEIKLHEL
ncbi:rhodanese-like domain-containing protein [Pseudohoeflea coraliihabitans]|uniref:Rhodanese domain-containing protein n=1 Tax=Pseudohoeflea coraliihabitans TaxID=2860393 RepID=A0ABS6WJ48_9HYPH|nr:rhodanese-like domain-containing protein [Pseudohoeflea sp. DP4N28-3]MBW3095810.1 hypothetical protein [Pseudohoeflea sp. DP4N28-3]